METSIPKYITPTQPRYDDTYWEGLEWLNTIENCKEDEAFKLLKEGK